MSRWSAVWLAASICAVARPAIAAPSFADANRAYLTGQWAEAADNYQGLVDAGVVHPDLYYNLANAHFRLGRLGPAVFNYRRALRIDPHLAEARDNLSRARAVVAARWGEQATGATGEPLWVRGARAIAPGTLALWFALANALFFGLLISIRLLSPGRLRWAAGLSSGLAGVATASLAGLLALQVWFFENTRYGVVLDDEVRLLEGRDAASRARAVLHAGLGVQIVGTDEEWVRVELPDRTEGWVRLSSIGEL